MKLEKNIYKSEDFFMIRKPLLPVNDFFNMDYIDNTYEHIQNIFKNDIKIRESILIASKSLYESILNNKGDREKIISSFIKYFSRMTTRTTPYGLFSGVSVRGFSNSIDNKIINPESIYKKRAKVDYEWLYKVIKQIESNYDVLLDLKVRTSTTIINKGIRIENKYITTSGCSSMDEKNKAAISIKNTELLKTVFFLSKDDITVRELRDILLGLIPQFNDENIKKYIIDLINKEYLISELKPAMSEFDQLNKLIDKIKYIEAAKEISSKLEIVRDCIKSYNDTEIGYGENLYIDIVDYMKEIVDAKNYIQVDMSNYFNSEDIDISVKDELDEFMDTISLLISDKEIGNSLKEYLFSFQEKYSYGQEVDFLELIDEDRGIGFPKSYKTNTFTKELSDKEVKIKKYIHNKILSEIGNEEIKITKNDLINIDADIIEQSKLPLSLELNFMIEKNEDKYNISLGPNIGSGSAGKMFGRFSDILKDEDSNKIKNMIYKEKKLINKDVLTAEITTIHRVGRLANVTTNPNYYEYELPLGTNSSKDKDHTLYLEDILVGVNNNKFYIKSKKHNKKIILNTHNMLNIRITNYIYRLLLDMSNNNTTIPGISNVLSVMNEFGYLPKIMIDNIILNNRRWILDKTFFYKGKNDNSYSTFKNNFKKWKEKNNVKSLVYMVESDNKLLIDLDKDIFLKIFFNEINKTTVILEEYTGQINYENYNKEKNMFSTEIVVPFIRTINDKDEYESPRKYYPEYDKNRMFLPLDKWIYIKLYCDKNREDEIISQYINPLMTDLEERKFINGSFFIRYSDSKSHIRLRIRCNELYKWQILNEIQSLNEDLFNKKLISDVAMDTYFREVERYGGIEVIEEAENYFNSDSKIIMSLIDMNITGKIKMDKRYQGVISIIKLLTDMGLDEENQIKLLDSVVKKDDYRKEFSLARKELLILCNSQDDWAGLNNTVDGYSIGEKLNLRSSSIKQYTKMLNKQLENNNITNDIDNIILSIIHMFCNRFYGTNRLVEREVMALTRHTLYSLKHFKRKKSA